MAVVVKQHGAEDSHDRTYNLTNDYGERCFVSKTKLMPTMLFSRFRSCNTLSGFLGGEPLRVARVRGLIDSVNWFSG